MSDEVSFKLTTEDIARYERQITAINLSIEQNLLQKIPGKINSLLNSSELTSIQASLLQDVSKLLVVLKNVPNLELRVRKRILFALQYFYTSNDEIPDNVVGLGFLDDAIVVKWIVDEVFSEYPEYFQA